MPSISFQLRRPHARQRLLTSTVVAAHVPPTMRPQAPASDRNIARHRMRRDTIGCHEQPVEIGIGPFAERLKLRGTMRVIRVGNAAGFWGDNLDAPRLLAEAGELDFLTLEYLAELTLSILAHQKSRDQKAGYVTDFPSVVESLLPCLQSQPNLQIVTNAGGMNPAACAGAVSKSLSSASLADVPVGVVDGDDVFVGLDDHLAAGESFANSESGESLDKIRRGVVSANAYLGAAGIVEALAQGARIVITGRVADASLTVGPAVHEFGWAWDDWNRLAMATVAGHLIECGAQVTGGNYSDWSPEIPLANVGYPIAEIAEDGAVLITKPEGTGGRVNTGIVAEQLVYEIGDPAHYLTPDVDADFSQVRLIQEGPDRVRVNDARGNAAPDCYKVSLAYRDGYMVSGTLVICGRDAEQKARQCAQIIFERVRRAGFELARTNVECLGAGDSLPGMFAASDDPATLNTQHSTLNSQPWDIVLRISAHDDSREAVDRLCRELAPFVTSGPPGVTGYTGPRPKPHPVLAYWPTTIARSSVSAGVIVKSAQEWAA